MSLSLVGSHSFPLNGTGEAAVLWSVSANLEEVVTDHVNLESRGEEEDVVYCL